MNQTELAQRLTVVEAARQWLGTPWHHRARVRGGGVDCAQLLIAVYSQAGLIDEFDPGDYAIDHMLHSDEELMQNLCAQYGRKTDSPAVGDIVLWRWGRSYSHAGIVIDWPQDGPKTVIHAFRPFGSVCETPHDASRLAGRPFVHYTFW